MTIGYDSWAAPVSQWSWLFNWIVVIGFIALVVWFLVALYRGWNTLARSTAVIMFLMMVYSIMIGGTDSITDKAKHIERWAHETVQQIEAAPVEKLYPLSQDGLVFSNGNEVIDLSGIPVVKDLKPGEKSYISYKQIEYSNKEAMEKDLLSLGFPLPPEGMVDMELHTP